MGNLTPAQYDEAGAEVSYIKPELPCASKDYHVSGLIAKAQIREYLSGTENSERQRNETQRVHSIDIANTCKNVDASVVMSKMAEGYTSMFDLTIVPAQSNVVLPEGEESHSGAEEHLSKQFRKELHLSQNAERRTPSSSVPSASTVEDQGSRSLAQTRSQQIFSFENGESRVPSTFKRTTPEAAQLSYVVGGTQTAFAEDVSSERSQQRQSLAPVTITANTAVPSRSSPLSESVQASSTASEHFNATPRGSYRKEIERQSSTHVRPSSEPIDAGALPRSILKQSTSVVSQDEYSANDLIDRRTAQDRCCEEVSQQIPHMPDVSSPSQGPHIAQFEAMHADRNTPFEMQSEEERFRIMQENLRRHRQRSLTPQHRYPQTSFNGPFFKLEEVSISQRPRSQSVAPLLSVQQPSDEERRYSPQEVSSQRGTSTQGYRLHSSYKQQNLERYNNLKMMSASEAELTQNDRLLEEENDDSPNVIYWPPPKERRRPASAMAKSITDPERIDEYRRQKQMELKAMKRREEEAMRYHQKQMNAMEMQQQRFYEQGGAGFMMGRGQSTQTMRSLSPSTDLQQGGTNHRSASIDTQELELLTTPQQMRVFETRPISVMSESVDSRDFLFSPSVSTWKRTYIVDATQPVAKNEILTSEELLEKERFDVDLLKRREAFIEKPQPKPEIFRTGKRWQPPPEQPYIWPTMRRPLSVQPGCEPVIDFAPGVPKYLDEVEYRWEPYVYSPGYKLERKNFTPTNSPPLSPIRGMGTGPLDEVAKRQTRYLITPSPDGSHRPKPAFGGPRATPSGGFYPHAPNAIKIVKKKLLHAARTPSPSVGEGDVDDVEVIHERNYHLLGDSASPSRSPERISRAHNERIAPSSSHRSTHYTRGRQPNVADWEKIYDLPPHSSTVTIKDVPPNVDVKRRLAQFEGVMPYFDTAHRSKIGRDEDARSKVSSDRRLGSPTAQQRYQDAERRRTPLQRQPRHNFVTEPKEQRYRSEAGTTLLRRFNAPATAVHVDTTVDQAQRSNTTSSRRKHNNTPTSIQQQEQHPQTAVQRRLQRQTTTPSPSAPSYERAHVYGPPALPSGHRRTLSPVTGYHTRNSTPSTSRERTERTVHVSRSANATPQQFAVPVRGSTEFAMMGSTRSIPFSGSTLETPISPRGNRIF